MTPLTPTQKAILQRLANGARLYGRVDDPTFNVLSMGLPVWRVPAADVLALSDAEYISPAFPWPEITDEGRHALSDSGGEG